MSDENKPVIISAVVIRAIIDSTKEASEKNGLPFAYYFPHAFAGAIGHDHPGLRDEIVAEANKKQVIA
jgi:sensor domain CHASE-containing protein